MDQKTYIGKMTGVPKNLGVDTFPDPVGHFGAPWRPFWILRPLIGRNPEQYNLGDFVFEDSDDNDGIKDKTNKISVNDIVDKLEKREDKKRGRSSPDNGERKIRQRSVAL